MADAILANRAAVAVMISERKQFEPRFRARVEKAHRVHMAAWVRNLRLVYPNHAERELDRAAHGVYAMLVSLAEQDEQDEQDGQEGQGRRNEQDAAADQARLRTVHLSMSMAALRNIPQEES
jgi:hypothetical protein